MTHSLPLLSAHCPLSTAHCLLPTVLPSHPAAVNHQNVAVQIIAGSG
jgi:hypothetical protein